MVSDKLMLDLLFEYGTPEEIEAVSQCSISKLQGLKNVYKIQGHWFPVSQTARRVSGWNPPCGSGKTVDPEMVNAVKNIILATPLLSFGNPVLWAIFSAVGLIVSVIGSIINNYQTDSNCVLLTNLLPAKLDPDWVREHITVQYYLDDSWGNREIGPGEHNWAMMEPFFVPQDPYIDVKVAARPNHEGTTCTMTMVCALFKNWSAHVPRRVRIDLICDAFPPEFSACADASVVNRELYGSELVACIPIETKQRLLVEYMNEARQSQGI